MAVASVKISTYYFSTWDLPYIMCIITVEIMYFLILNISLIFLDCSRDNKNRVDNNTVFDQYWKK